MDNLYIRILPELNKLVPSSEAIQAAIDDPGWFSAKPYESPDPRPDVEAIFARILGDNIENETVQQLIDGVVKLIRQREARL